MSTCIENIVQELVEKRFNDLLEDVVCGVNNDERGYKEGSLYKLIRTRVLELLQTEVEKRDDELKKKVKDLIDERWNLGELKISTFLDFKK